MNTQEMQIWILLALLAITILTAWYRDRMQRRAAMAVVKILRGRAGRSTKEGDDLRTKHDEGLADGYAAAADIVEWVLTSDAQEWPSAEATQRLRAGYQPIPNGIVSPRPPKSGTGAK